MMVILPYSGLNISMGLILPEKGTDTAQIMVIYIYYIAFSLCLFVSNKRTLTRLNQSGPHFLWHLTKLNIFVRKILSRHLIFLREKWRILKQHYKATILNSKGKAKCLKSLGLYIQLAAVLGVAR